jgi:hypothetical protein
VSLPQCPETGKLSYPSRDAAAQSRGSRRNKGRKMRVYMCEYCHRWHLSSEVYAR